MGPICPQDEERFEDWDEDEEHEHDDDRYQDEGDC